VIVRLLHTDTRRETKIMNFDNQRNMVDLPFPPYIDLEIVPYFRTFNTTPRRSAQRGEKSNAMLHVETETRVIPAELPLMLLGSYSLWRDKAVVSVAFLALPILATHPSEGEKCENNNETIENHIDGVS
jgi:hypothetical protein